MTPTRQKQFALMVSIVIGAASGPFLFRAAGFTHFPQNHISHFMIIFCYTLGSIEILKSIFLRLLRALPNASSERQTN